MIPTVSIIMPLYNKQEWVSDTMKSVLNQTFQDFELLIIDDGSTDKSIEIVKSFNDNRIRVIHQANQGVSIARNRGIAESKGKYIAFIDADDIWREKHLEYMIKAFELYPDIILSANRIVTVQEENTHKRVSEIKDIKYSSLDYIDMLYKNRFLIHIGSVLLRKDMIVKIESFFEDLKMGEDVNMLIRISCEGKAVISNYIGMIYQLSDTQGAMLSDIGVRYLPKYLKGLKRDRCSKANNLKLKKFIFTEYLKKAYQNRKYQFDIKELISRDAGEEYRLGAWSIIPYLIVRFMPKIIYKILGKKNP